MFFDRNCPNEEVFRSCSFESYSIVLVFVFESHPNCSANENRSFYREHPLWKKNGWMTCPKLGRNGSDSQAKENPTQKSENPERLFQYIKTMICYSCNRIYHKNSKITWANIFYTCFFCIVFNLIFFGSGGYRADHYCSVTFFDRTRTFKPLFMSVSRLFLDKIWLAK